MGEVGVPTELKTKRTELFEGNTLVRSVMHALTRRRRQLGRGEEGGKKKKEKKKKKKCCKLHPHLRCFHL